MATIIPQTSTLRQRIVDQKLSSQLASTFFPIYNKDTEKTFVAFVLLSLLLALNKKTLLAQF